MYMESRKTVLMNPFTGMERRHRCTERACGPSGAGGDRGTGGAGSTSIHTLSRIERVTGRRRRDDAGSPVGAL